jgi:folate-binding protein YgfZ
MPASPLLASIVPAAVADLAGWRLAADFGDVEAEVAAAHESAILLDRSVYGRLAVGGPDAAAWLNRIVSNDIAALAPGGGQRAFLLTVKGHLACDLRVYRLAEGLLLTTAFDTAEGLLGQLRRFKLYGDRVELADRRPDTVELGLRGPAALAVAAEVTGLDLGGLATPGVVEAGELLLLATDELGLPGVDLIAPAARGAELWRRLAPCARPAGWQAAEILRLEAGAPRWGAELTPDVLPAETGLDSALSHTKGCYPGQEFVARLRDRGHVNRLLRPLAFAGEEVPARGSVLLAGEQTVGAVTSAARSPRLGVRALGYVRVAHAAPGTRLSCEGQAVEVL